MKEVYITMGLPCCGKTKYCYDHADSIANVYNIETFQETKKSEIVYIDADIHTNKQLNIFFKLYLNKNIKIHIVYFKENKEQSIYNLECKYSNYGNVNDINNIKTKIECGKLEYPDNKRLCFDFDIIEIETFICPNYYKNLDCNIKEHLYGDFLFLYSWNSDYYEIESNSLILDDNEEEPDSQLSELINNFFPKHKKLNFEEIEKSKIYIKRKINDDYMSYNENSCYINIHNLIL